VGKVAKASNKPQLPAGFKKVEARVYDPMENAQLVGVIVSFFDVPKKDFHDGNYVPGSKQRVAKVRDDAGIVWSVYESGALGPLFDLGIGERVAIVYLGMRKIEGREKPMKDFAVGVLE
jgi:hypothetical protein